MAGPEAQVLKKYSLIGDAIYYHHSRTESTGEEYLHPSEVHRQHEMLLLLEGEISYMIEGEIYTATAGDMIFVAPGEIHAIRINGTKPYERLVLLFDMDALEKMSEALHARLDAFSYGGKNQLHILPRALVESYGLNTLFSDILACEEEEKYKRLLILSTLLSFLIQTDKLIAEHKDRLIAPSLEDGMLRAVATYVDAHIGDPIGLDDIARSLFISKSTLCHRFAKQMHMTINFYIAIKKMHRAADLLRKGHGATEVAAMVGYDNYTTFFYNFKRIMGASPTEMK